MTLAVDYQKTQLKYAQAVRRHESVQKIEAIKRPLQEKYDLPEILAYAKQYNEKHRSLSIYKNRVRRSCKAAFRQIVADSGNGWYTISLYPIAKTGEYTYYAQPIHIRGLKHLDNKLKELHLWSFYNNQPLGEDFAYYTKFATDPTV